MPILESSYGTVAGVQAIIPRKGTLSEDTLPSLGDVEQAINGISSEIDVELIKCGFEAPVNKTTYPFIARLLENVCNWGAAATVEIGLLSEANRMDADDKGRILEDSYVMKRKELFDMKGYGLVTAGLPRKVGYRPEDGLSVSGATSQTLEQVPKSRFNRTVTGEDDGQRYEGEEDRLIY